MPHPTLSRYATEYLEMLDRRFERQALLADGPLRPIGHVWGIYTRSHAWRHRFLITDAPEVPPPGLVAELREVGRAMTEAEIRESADTVLVFALAPAR